MILLKCHIPLVMGQKLQIVHIFALPRKYIEIYMK